MNRGAGLSSCGRWTANHQGTNPLGGNEDSWVLGYLTAYNREVFKGHADVAEGVDTDGILSAVTKYCADHPLENIAGATDEVIGQLFAHWLKTPAALAPEK